MILKTPPPAGTGNGASVRCFTNYSLAYFPLYDKLTSKIGCCGGDSLTVQEIIDCPKTITRKRKPDFPLDNRSYRMDIDLECDLPGINLVMFLRRSQEFAEDFSVGLRLKTPNPIIEYTIVLYRNQGPHGAQSPDLTMRTLHNDYHCHFYSEDDLFYRRKTPSLKNKQTAGFSSFEGAVVNFLTTCNVSDPNNIFREERERVGQVTLFELIERGDPDGHTDTSEPYPSQGV